jgi:hypothetical protein
MSGSQNRYRGRKEIKYEHKQRRIVGGKENKKLRRMTENTIRIMQRLRNKNTSIRKINLKMSRTNKKCDEEAREIGTGEYETESK